MKIFLFGGTAEGHLLAERLAEAGNDVTCAVATEYGQTVLEPRDNLTVLVGRLTAGEMAERLEGFDVVVDATHPYADKVSENIRAAAAETATPYYRLLRPREEAEDVLWADSPADAAAKLQNLPGNVLLTTGSKDLKTFTAVKDYPSRLFVRVLPSVESLTAALSLGYPASHVICMQGPFPQALNQAMVEAVGAKVLVTKDTGKAGGFLEKAEAARAAGAKLLVIRRPTEETGYTLDALLELLLKGGQRP